MVSREFDSVVSNRGISIQNSDGVGVRHRLTSDRSARRSDVLLVTGPRRSVFVSTGRDSRALLTDLVRFVLMLMVSQSV